VLQAVRQDTAKTLTGLKSELAMMTASIAAIHVAHRCAQGVNREEAVGIRRPT
jgi:hypothetical protein